MLQALMIYAERRLPGSEPGFKTREVRWSVELTADGRFLNVLPLGDGKRGEDQPRCPDMHGMNAGGKAISWWRPRRRQRSCSNRVRAEESRNRPRATSFLRAPAGRGRRHGPAAGALGSLVEDPDRLAELRAALATQKANPPTGSAGGSTHDPRLDEMVQAWWREWRRADLGGRTGCRTQAPTRRRSQDR